MFALAIASTLYTLHELKLVSEADCICSHL
jgi:hypothetical protein